MKIINKKGLGHMLIEQVITHDKLQSVQSFELYCKEDKIPFYEKWGFTDEIGDLHLMRRVVQ